MSKSKPTGIRRRHARTCTSKSCSCPWEVFVYDKREQKKHRKTFASQAEAKSWRADKLVASERGKLRGPTKMTVRQAAEEFLAGARDGSIRTSARRPYKPATIRSYDEALRLRVLDVLGHLRLSDVQRRDVQDLADKVAEDWSASTVQNTIDPLRVIFRRAISRDLLAVDPTEGLDLARPDGRRDRIASPAEAEELLAALRDEDRAMWATAFYTGLRRGELRALRVSDIDLDARVIHVQRGWDAKEGEQDPKSAAANRRVPILNLLVPTLTAHLDRAARIGEALVFGRTATESFVPSTARARALAAWKAENERRVKRASGGDVELLSPITLHEARHTCASLLIAAGVNPKALSVIMGHATISMTFDTYGHLMPGGLDEAAAAANDYLARLAGGPALRVVGS